MEFEPLSTELTYNVEMQNVAVELSMPPTSTIGAFLNENSRRMISIEYFLMENAYRYSSIVEGFQPFDFMRSEFVV
jgi:hypothetical protein